MLIGVGLVPTSGLADDACRRALEERVKTCADQCLERARAAVAPEIRDRIKGYGCVNNCSKLEMFNGHSCPAEP